MRRFIGKPFMLTANKSVVQAAESLQFCLRDKAYVESAVNNMVDLFSSNEFTSIVQMDVVRALNNLNGNFLLYNIKMIYSENKNCFPLIYFTFKII